MASFILLLIVSLVDLWVRWDFIGHLQPTRMGLYALTVLLEASVLYLLLSIIRTLRESGRHLLGLGVIAILVIWYSFLIIAGWGFYKYFQSLPGVLAFTYLLEEPQDFVNIISSSLDVWNSSGVLLIGLAAGWALWMSASKLSKPSRPKVFYSGVSAVSLMMVLVLNHNLEMGFGSALPVTDSVFALKTSIKRHFFPTDEQIYLQRRMVTDDLSPVPQRAPFNVVFIINESLRKQSMSLYGYSRRTTPELERLAEKVGEGAVIFEHAFSNATQTYISVPSLLSGINPVQGMDTLQRAPLIYEMFDRFQDVKTALISSHSYLVGNFSAYLSSSHLDYMWFRETDDLPKFNNMGADDRYVPEQFSSWLASVPQQEHFFAVLHLNGSHYPYRVPEDYQFFTGEPRFDAYDNSIAYVDSLMGRIFESLESSDRFENTLIVVTSDHGESFGEDGSFGHMGRFSRASANVPLAFFFPKRVLEHDASVVRDLKKNLAKIVSNVDVVPTILDIANLPAPKTEFLGHSLVSKIPAERPVYLYNLSHRNLDRQYLTVFHRTSSWTIARNMATGTLEGARHEIGALDLDGGNNLWNESPLAERSELIGLIRPFSGVLERMIGDPKTFLPLEPIASNADRD